jgi:SAM-dependent methyltransferase
VNTSVDPLYASGEYFSDASRHSGDAAFKASTFLALLTRTVDVRRWPVSSYVDVGSGSGDAVRLVANGLKRAGAPLYRSLGYDVSPHVSELAPVDDVEFVHGDFTAIEDFVDLVTLFDVVEHVTEPAEFLKRIARRCHIVGLHLPLDNSFNAGFRDLFRTKVKDPGHITFMDGVTALNLLSGAGLRVLDYEYTMSFEAPSGRSSLLAKVLLPFRRLVARLSPWLLSKTLGGASLMVVALTPSGASRMEHRS